MKGATNDAADVGVDRGLCMLVREGQHSPRGVATDSGKRAKRIAVGRDDSLVPVDDTLRKRVEVGRAAVVPQPIPLFPNRAGRCISEVPDGGERGEKPRVILLDAAHLGLLQHEFGDHDPVGITGPAPRQVTSVATKPAQQTGPKRALSRLATGNS